jgi:predicted TIM-barrel fold metal-dependent hydrolase
MFNMRRLTHTIIFASLSFLSFAQKKADSLLLNNYKPVSIYKTPNANIQRASFAAIDMHSHDYVETKTDVDDLVKLMDKMNIKKTMILTYTTGKSFDSAVEKYNKYPDRFELFCGFDYTGYGTPGWQEHAVQELERCYKKGAKGVGELGDKGEGELYSKPTPGKGLHIDDPQMKPLLEKCAALNMPISIHVAEDEWMYENPDSTNDGMMNAATWHVDMNKPNRLGHDALQKSLENAVRENPKTIFIACHLLNACANLQQLGDLLDKYPNLYADIAARFGEIAPVPRYAAAFITKYQDRLVYGTDNDPDEHMYLTTFRILETADEHFYEPNTFNYHWALYGLNLSKEVLEKLYYKNAAKIMNYK